MTGFGARRSGFGARGFTVVELLMAIVVLSTVTFGIMAFERGIVRSNEQSRNLTAGMAVADYWMEHARTEALLWRTNAATDLADAARTPMLNAVTDALLAVPGASTGWLDVPPAGASPRFNRHLEEWTIGSPPAVDVGEFCAQYRITVLTPAPDELLRIEVRVLWYKVGVDRTADWAVCPSAGMLSGGLPNIEKVHMVQVASTLRRNAQ